MTTHTPTKCHVNKRPRRGIQTGAALVVGLILLLAISLLAIANLRSGSVELIATSNQQYHARAFLSAEAAIERAMRSEAAFNSARDFSVASHVGTGIGKDSFRYTVTRPTNGAIQQVPTGNSEGVFGAIYFKITATGYSDHETIAENTQELYQIVPLADSITYNPKACAHSTSLDGTVANC